MPKNIAFSLVSISLMIGLFTNASAQGKFWNTNDAYLGENPPTDSPKIFAPKMLIDSGIVLGRIAFSRDGKEFYYGYARHWFDFNGTGIKQIVFDGKK